ncbi:Uridine kinase [Pseudoruegeria aquimaris]|uniref:Uridine kinase n=1 Tax=Pseudoruegeria aquimaris TaxID=393663 RepID=A0A1Y5SWQ8_9RHOB|nr:nucleoside/nucleotide kinase family protein [Pseudoruegeria aquimaris]SLN49564.1 Uridine kinase [Pseudoruegeria aquimaris]
MSEAAAEAIAARAAGRSRFVVAIAGAPGSGKSTLAETIGAILGERACVVPMDGFHLDNALLDARGWRSRKGAPHTFDLHGLRDLILRLNNPREPVYYPIFDRAADLSRAAAGCVLPEQQIVLVEGNYLLLDRPGWRDLKPLFDMSVFLRVDVITLQQRLMARWEGYGLGPAEAEAKTAGNDLPNAQLVTEESLPADLELVDGILARHGRI